MPTGPSSVPLLPPPFATPSVDNYSKLIPWAEGKVPAAPTGFSVTLFADKLDHPRQVRILSNGDILVAESHTELKSSASRSPEKTKGMLESGGAGKSANRITLLRDADRNGRPEFRSVLLSGLHQPFGIEVIGDSLYVANTDGVMRYPFRVGDTTIKTAGKKIVELPAGGYNNHWTRNLLASPDGKKLYVSVGSASNVAEHGIEHERRRANILQVNPDGSNERVYASGLRNPVGMDWAPGTNALWSIVNERDGLGDELVPDYLTEVREGAFYGWPYSYFGQHEDPRRKGERPEQVKKAVVPDLAVGNHVAALGLVFYRGNAFPEKYREGAFVALHGSWNRSILSGYKVQFVPFRGGKPSGPPEDFLTGFIANGDKEVYGRPVSLALFPDGSLLVVDDAGNRIWRVSTQALQALASAPVSQ